MTERNDFFDELHRKLSQQWGIPSQMVHDIRKWHIGYGRNHIEMITSNFNHLKKSQRNFDNMLLRITELTRLVRNPSTPPLLQAKYTKKIANMEKSLPSIRNKIEYRQTFDLVLNKLTPEMFSSLTVITPHDKLYTGDQKKKRRTTH